MKENLQSNTDKHTRITVEYLKEGFESTNFTAKVVQILPKYCLLILKDINWSGTLDRIRRTD